MIVCWNAWPICNVPVTLGGGNTIENLDVDSFAKKDFVFSQEL